MDARGLFFGGGTVTSYFGIQENFPVFLVGVIALLFVFLGFIAGAVARTRKQFLVLAGLVVAACALVFLYSLFVQHKQEAARIAAEQKAAEQYYVEFVSPSGSPAYTGGYGPNGGLLMAQLRIAWVFNNPNNFDLYVKVFRRHVQLANFTSDSMDKPFYAKIPRGAKNWYISDKTIIFRGPAGHPQPIEITGRTRGLLDFEMCYGRQRNRMSKGFWHKVELTFYEEAQSTGGEPIWVPVDLVEGGFGYRETCNG